MINNKPQKASYMRSSCPCPISRETEPVVTRVTTLCAGKHRRYMPFLASLSWENIDYNPCHMGHKPQTLEFMSRNCSSGSSSVTNKFCNSGKE